LQDLSQARARWGDQAADGMLSLFQTKLILPGVCDPKTLEAVSLVLGEYDRQLVSSTVGVTRSSTGMFSDVTTAKSETVVYSTTRQRTLSPGEVAAIPKGHGLLVRGASWGLLTTTPYYAAAPWKTLALPTPRVSVGTSVTSEVYAAGTGRPPGAPDTAGAVIATERSCL